LEKACNQTKKELNKIKGKGLGTQPQKRPHPYISGWFKKVIELGYFYTELGRPAGGAVCEGRQDVPADSPANCVPHPEQSTLASHICHTPCHSHLSHALSSEGLLFLS